MAKHAGRGGSARPAPSNHGPPAVLLFTSKKYPDEASHLLRPSASDTAAPNGSSSLKSQALQVCTNRKTLGARSNRRPSPSVLIAHNQGPVPLRPALEPKRASILDPCPSTRRPCECWLIIGDSCGPCMVNEPMTLGSSFGWCVSFSNSNRLSKIFNEDGSANSLLVGCLKNNSRRGCYQI